MEVLSVGEKIKRARIYKGYTLKDVCGNKISVSKLSCIENDKVDPEDWVLEYVASKLNLDIDFLKQSIEEQIVYNINQILKSKLKKDYEKNLMYNMEMAEKHRYYRLAFSIMHILFEHCVSKNNLIKAQELLGKYYDLCNNSNEKVKRYVYYMDVARFFYKNKEFLQASNYFRNVKKNLIENKYKDYDMLVESIYGEVMCNIILKNYKNAYETSQMLNDLFQFIDDDLKRAKLYHVKAVLSLLLGDGQFQEYKQKVYDIYSNDNYNKAKVMSDYASAMFEINDKEKGVYYINEAINLYPKDDKRKLVKFMLICIEMLISNNILEEASKLIEDILDYSISLDNIRFIQKSYYLKATLLIKKNDLISAEMYMNLSLDALTKFGTRREIYKRYMEMGQMYYKIGMIKDSLKYFTLAISLKKRL